MFGTVRVVDDGVDRYLVFGGTDDEDQQSWIKKGAPGALPMEYLQAAAVGLAIAPRRVLLIGLGGGAFATFVATRLPSTRVEAVEIDPVVARVARDYFALPASVQVHVADGAAFLANTSDRWDLILVDAYGNDDYPRHLGTADFFRQLFDRLTPDGAAVLNIAALNRRTEQQLVDRFAAAGDRCWVIPVESTDADNTVLLAGRRGPTRQQLRAGAAKIAPRLGGVPVRGLAGRVTRCEVSVGVEPPSAPAKRMPAPRKPAERTPKAPPRPAPPPATPPG